MTLLLALFLTACDTKATGPAGGSAADADSDGFSADDGDCDDADAAVFPGAAELCNGADDDCDGTIDEDATDTATFYADGDGDGYGGADTTDACTLPDGHASEGGDCDDTDASVSPGAAELCNGADDDCDGTIDKDATDAVVVYDDGDGDGHGAPETGRAVCTADDGTVENGDDCDDTDADVSPSATELCNGIDDDCDPTVSEDGLITTGGANHSDLQAAIDAAGDGDTVDICAGTHRGLFRVRSKDLTLQGRGAETTILDGERQNTLLVVFDGAVTLSGLTLQGGFGFTAGNIDARRATGLTVEDCVVTAGESDEDGGGIYGPDSGLMTLRGTSVTGNIAFESGAGVFATDLVVEDSDISDNVAGYRGGGLCVEGGSLEMDAKSSVSGNSADYEGGGLFALQAVVELDDTPVSDNTAVDRGGGAALQDSLLDGGTFDGNSASSGGGVYLTGSAGGGLSGATVTDNTATASGGGVYIDSDDMELDAVDITGNTATIYGGGVSVDGGAGLLIGSSTIDGNDAQIGGGIALDQVNSASIEGSDISDNTADFGAAAYADAARLTLDGGSVTGNAASYEGGGLYLDTGVELEVYGVDFGTGSSDNSPEDVYAQEADASYSYGSAATFGCDGRGC